jgi:hypothetical protein
METPDTDKESPSDYRSGGRSSIRRRISRQIYGIAVYLCLMGRDLFEFIEVLGFSKKLDEIAGPETLRAIQSDLIENPERWPVIRGTNGARKGRVADPHSSRGKRGSFRYYYLYLSHRGRVYLLAIFSKGEASDLSTEQKKKVAAMIAAIQKEA